MEQMPEKGGAMRMHSRLWVFALSAIFFANCLYAQEKESTDAHESLVIARGDLLHVTVLRESDLDKKVRVSDAGDISLPLIGSVHVAGLTPTKAAASIADKYLSGQFLRHPDVSVFIEEYATQSVSVLGQVMKPGAINISTARSLIDVLAMAGGLTESADRHIAVERAGSSQEQAEVFLSNRPEDAFNANILIYPGDKILVPKAGIVYVLGDVGRPGGYVMQNDSRMTVLQAIALAAGVNRTASEKQARLVHNENGQTKERILPLKDMERGQAPDELLEANDIIYIPFSLGKNLVLGTNAIVASSTSALIYAGR
jgi:polysaccharide biosynthesis/export protein